MKTSLLSLLCFIFCLSFAHGQDQDSWNYVESQRSECIKKSNTLLSKLECEMERSRLLQASMDAMYDTLMIHLPTQFRPQLLDEQDAWLKLQRVHNDFLEKLYEPKGMSYMSEIVFQKGNFIKERLKALEMYLKLLEID